MIAAALAILAAQACAQQVVSMADVQERGSLTLTERSSIAIPFAEGVHGISAMVLDDSPHHLIAFSDRGEVHRLSLTFGADEALEAVRSVAKAPANTAQTTTQEPSDIESAVQLQGGGWLLGLERPHRLVMYADGELETFSQEVGRWSPPKELSLLASNEGIESMVGLQDGRLLMISEGFRKEGHHLWIGLDGNWSTGTYRTAPGFAPVDAKRHPCGGLLILERAATLLRGITAQLVYLSDDQIRRAEAGEIVVPQLIGPIEPEAGSGNFEALVVLPNDNGNISCRPELDILVMTDDNFLRLFSRVLAHYTLSDTRSG